MESLVNGRSLASGLQEFPFPEHEVVWPFIRLSNGAEVPKVFDFIKFHNLKAGNSNSKVTRLNSSSIISDIGHGQAYFDRFVHLNVANQNERSKSQSRSMSQNPLRFIGAPLQATDTNQNASKNCDKDCGDSGDGVPVSCPKAFGTCGTFSGDIIEVAVVIIGFGLTAISGGVATYFSLRSWYWSACGVLILGVCCAILSLIWGVCVPASCGA